jgi:hypothetical protein
VFNMSGNVAEWENSCDGAGNGRVRGGSRSSSPTGLRCDADALKPINDNNDPEIGVRCCLCIPARPRTASAAVRTRQPFTLRTRAEDAPPRPPHQRASASTPPRLSALR